MFVPSKYQKLVYTYMDMGKGNVVISAVAGSGKSTTIVNALKRIPESKSVLFLAFNKSIVEELKKKIGDLPNVEISTLHSLGTRALRSALGSRIEASKYTKYINERMQDKTLQSDLYDKLTSADRVTWRTNVQKLLDVGRANLCENESMLLDLAIKHDLELKDNEISVVLELMDWGRRNFKVIDFTDMIYLPNVLKIRMQKYDWVFIDECQDLNAAQRELFLKCVKPTGRFIAVGDEKQSIYGFAGADTDSFRKLKEIPHTAKLPLSICYRCDQSIIELAKTIVPQIQWREGAPMGTIDRNALAEDVQDGDMILCRITAPLVTMCMKYIAKGRKAFVKGRDIGANLINLIESTELMNIDDVLEELRRQAGKIIGKLIAKNLVRDEEEAKEHPKYVTLIDKIESIEAISQGLTKSKDVVAKIKTIFADDNGQGICLSTIHKSKGLENDRVFIIREDKMPLKGCMNIDWMREQEYNLMYVAYTRAKHYLGFIKDEVKESIKTPTNNEITT